MQLTQNCQPYPWTCEANHKSLAAGEAFNGDPIYVAQFQVATPHWHLSPLMPVAAYSIHSSTAQGALTGMLSYPLYYALRDCFMGAGGGGLLPMSRISSFLNHKNGSYYQHFKDVSLLATFIDNHDNPRFLNKQNSQQLYRNALAMVIFSVGIPMCVCV